MAHRFDQGFLSHTTAARPYWVGDVDVHELHRAVAMKTVRRGNAWAPLGRALAALRRR